MKKANKRRYSGQQPGTKSGRRPADKPLTTGDEPQVNRGMYSSIGLHQVSFVRASCDWTQTVPNREQGIGHKNNVRVMTRVSRRVSAH